MSTKRGNPLHTGVLGNILTPRMQEQVEDLWQRVIEGDNARQQWIHKQEKLLRQRRGVRKKKVFPWPGANNHSWPLTDAIIRRWKPGINSLVLKADPVTYFFPQNLEAQEASPKAQDYFHWRFTTMDKITHTVNELTDNIAQYGAGYTRQGWDYRTDKKCRIVNVKILFPNGVQAAVEQFNQEVAQARIQVEQAVQAGKVPEEALQQIPQETTPEKFVMETLEDEYILRSDDPMEAAQLQDATQKILEGAELVKFYYTIDVTDKPCWRSIDPMNIFYPPRNTDPDTAEYIGIIHRFHIDELVKMALDGFFDLESAELVADKIRANSTSDPDRGDEFDQTAGSSRSQIVNVLDRADGISQGDVDEPKIGTFVELYCHLDIDNDGLSEKVVVWYHPLSKTLLAAFAYPYPFNSWPITKFEMEHNSPRHYSPRGIAELVTVFQATVNKLHNARLDAIQITLAPMFTKRHNAGDIQRSIKFMPGTVIPVQTQGDFAPVQMDTRGLLQSLNEENVTKGLAEQYIGTFDPGILNNGQERRTATEVEAVISQTQTIFGNDADLFQDSMAKVFKQIWRLDMEFGAPDLFFRVTGEENPISITRAEIDKDFDIIPAGTPANTSRPLAIARVREALQLFGADQTGLINKHELFRHYFNVIDNKLGKLIVRAPEEAALFQQLQQAVAATGQEPAPPP